MQDGWGNAQSYGLNPSDAAFLTLDGIVHLMDAANGSFTSSFAVAAPGPHKLQVSSSGSLQAKRDLACHVQNPTCQPEIAASGA